MVSHQSSMLASEQNDMHKKNILSIFEKEQAMIKSRAAQENICG